MMEMTLDNRPFQAYFYDGSYVFVTSNTTRPYDQKSHFIAVNTVDSSFNLKTQVLENLGINWHVLGRGTIFENSELKLSGIFYCIAEGKTKFVQFTPELVWNKIEFPFFFHRYDKFAEEGWSQVGNFFNYPKFAMDVKYAFGFLKPSFFDKSFRLEFSKITQLYGRSHYIICVDVREGRFKIFKNPFRNNSGIICGDNTFCVFQQKKLHFFDMD